MSLHNAFGYSDELVTGKKGKAAQKAVALRKKIATGYGYKNPTGKGGGKKYSYPIKDQKHLDIVKSAGGEFKLHKK